jgi:hypothetical protein
MPSRTAHPRTRTTTVLTGAVLVAVLTAAAWFGWLGWDHEYQIDPVTQHATGPYEAWQVVGCVLSLLAIALAAGVAVHPVVPLAVMPLTFTVVWSLDAAPRDDTGLWAVGAVMLLVGMLLGASVVAGVTVPLRDRWARRHLPAAA